MSTMFYVTNPDGTVTFAPTPEDYTYVREEERDLLDGVED